MTSQTEQTSVSRWQRSLLPADLLETSGDRRSARDWLVDAVLFVIAIAIGTAVLVASWDDHNVVGGRARHRPGVDRDRRALVASDATHSPSRCSP